MFCLVGTSLDNHCYPYICPSHCKDSHTLHIKKMAANLTQILNFKANFYQEFELFSLFSKKKIYANNGGHFKIVSIIKNIKFVHISLIRVTKTVSSSSFSL